MIHRGGKNTHILYSSISTDTCFLKQTFVKEEALIQLLYLSKINKIQGQKCSLSIEVKSMC